MEYQKTNVNAFLGLDNNQRPELIKDQEASDIENLRFDKLGYLINRNGVQLHSLNPDRFVSTVDGITTTGILWSIGTMGLTEYVIEKPWGIGSGEAAVHPYDDATLNAFSPTAPNAPKFTDRFMVYAVRIPAAKPMLPSPYTSKRTDNRNNSNVNSSGVATDMANQYTWRYKAAYILVPLTGPTGFRDSFAFAPNGNMLNAAANYQPVDGTLPTLLATMGSRSIVRADDKPSKLQIYAPARWLGVHNEFADNGIPKDLNWIEHYVTMQQYRESVVISDMTNGDMYIVDEYMESEYQDTKKHRFTMRENALAHFDVDDVVVDFGITGFNNGVKAPMALYKFYLKRSRFNAAQDNFAPLYSELDKSPILSTLYNGSLLDWHMNANIPNGTCFIRSEYWQGTWDGYELQACGLVIDSSTNYTFSSNANGDEYDDLFLPLTLQNPDIKEDDQVATDVYLWKDFEINYFPASGAIQGSVFLTALDRTWDKTSSGGTKLIKLSTKTGVEQDVPLGVWRYRFVWYMGNGEYSAPSSELLVPDMLFSGMRDSEITASFPVYQRPVGLDSYDDAEQTGLTLSATGFLNQLVRAQGGLMFNSVGALTSYGQNFVNIKQALFDSSHIFSAKYATTGGASWPTNWTAESSLAKGQVSVFCTMFFENDYAVLEGVFAETLNSIITLNDGGATFGSYSLYNANTTKLRVPLWGPTSIASTEYVSFNSVFTSYGCLRTVYQNTARNSASAFYSANYPAYQIVFEGKQRYGADKPYSANDNQGWVTSDVVRNGKGIWFNLVPFQGGVVANAPYPGPPPSTWTVEKNNYPDNESVGFTPFPKYYEFRNMTVVRGVRKHTDRMLFVKPSIPSEVISRIVLSGSGEIPLCTTADTGTWVSEKNLYVPPPSVAGDFLNLEFTDQRVFTNVGLDGGILYSHELPFYNTRNAASNYIRANYVSNTIRINNLNVYLSGPGERLTIPEQLSMYIPASLLFEAPHIKLVIPTNRIPRRARQLLIFRTRASHDNAWQPHDYGLVKTVDIKRDANGNPVDYANNQLSFLDDVKSSELDYSYALNDYDGFTKPIKSRFCLPLNERVFYANIKESYKPHKPRTALDVVNTHTPDTTAVAHRNIDFGSQTEMARLWSYKLFKDATTSPTYINDRYLYYFIAYNDQARSFSLASCSGEIDRGNTDPVTGDPTNDYNKPVFFCMPSAYDPSVEQANIYRLQLSAPIEKITLTTSRTSNIIQAGRVYYVVQGVVEYNGTVYYPNDVIQTYYGNDVGYDATYVNRFVNYFEILSPATNDRGNAGSYCQPILYNITNYFDGAAGPNYIEKIGTIKPEDEGIFYDNDLPSLGRLPLKQIFQNEDVMPAGLRWSEPYQSNKIKLASLMEVRSGDGDQITGLAMLYGNLIVLKERSMHRLAVQGAAVPVSRVDEISNNVGCIAPNTIITVNNTLYFLSWAGFYKYDNNVLSKVDGNFAEELQLRLRSSQNGVINPAIRDASCGWNSAYRELYLTIPVMSSSTNEGDTTGQYNGGVTLVDNKNTRIVRGVTYAMNVDNGLVTKYRYMDDSIYFTDPQVWPEQVYPYSPRQRAPRVYSRLYYTNSLGQMRSAEVLPPRTFNYLNPATFTGNNASMEFMRASFFIESPTKDLNNRDKPKDDYLTFMQDQITNQYGIFPTSKFVRIFWASKSWTAEDKSVLKRIRKVFAYISASDDPTIVRGIVHTSPEGETATTDIAWQYTFADTRITSIRLGYSVTGELLSIPTEASGSSSAPSQNRGERHLFEVEGSGAFQMEYFGFNWKPINQYER